MATPHTVELNASVSTPRRQPEPTPRDMFAIVRRRIVPIVSVTLLTIVLAIIYLLSVSPRYASNAQILLGEQGLSSRSTFDLLEAQALTNSVIEGELAILRSGALLVRVADRLDLMSMPEFNAELRPDDPGLPVISAVGNFIKSLRTSLFAPGDMQDEEAGVSSGTNPLIANAAAAGDPSLRENDAIVGQLRQQIDVRQLGSSFVVQVSASSDDPVMAAAVTNTLMEEYIGFLTDKRFQAAQRFTNWLEVRVEELAVKLEESEQAALAFRSVMESDADSRDRLNQQMRELTSKVVNARADLAQVSAMSNRTATIAENDGPLAAADVLSSDEIMRYRSELGDLRREAANAAINFGENSLQTRSIGRAIGKVEEAVSLEVNRAIDELHNRAEVSDAVVQSLEGALSELESLVLARSGDEIKLNQLQRIADANKRVYEEFLGRFKETSEIQNLQSADAEVISYASPPSSAAYPRKKLGVVLAGAGGLFAGLALAVLLELMPRRIATSSDLSQATGLAIYGSVPRPEGRNDPAQMLRILNRKPTGAIAQSARRLMNNVDMRAGDHARSIVIAGAGPGTAKSSIALMLGWAAMQSGRTCIVVDTDLHQARLSTALRLIDRTGRTDRATLIDVLYQVATLDQAVQSLEPSGLRVLACAPIGTEPSLLFNTARAKSIVEDLLNRYDIVIFDTPLLTDTSDAFTLPMQFDVGLFVAESGKTLFTQVETGLEVLSETDLANTGAVLANTRRAIGS